MKIIFSTTLTFLLLVISNILVSILFKIPFLELSFMIGLIFTLFIGFFSSQGGPLSDIVDAKFKHLMEKESRTKNHFMEFKISIPFIVSLIYTILSGIVSIIVYWEYF